MLIFIFSDVPNKQVNATSILEGSLWVLWQWAMQVKDRIDRWFDQIIGYQGSNGHPSPQFANILCSPSPACLDRLGEKIGMTRVDFNVCLPRQSDSTYYQYFR